MASDIDIKVKDSLKGTRFEASELASLSGGSVNWTYVATLAQPLEDGTRQVMVKHGETHMMTKPDFALTLIRCRLESQCFKILSGNPFADDGKLSSPRRDITVRTPRYHDFDEKHTNQIVEYLPNGVTLKDYILKYSDSAAAATSQGLSEAESRDIGRSLGAWLRSFTRWAKGNADLKKLAAENVEAKQVRHMVNFAWLSNRVKEYPAQLKDAEDILLQVNDAMMAEGEDETNLQCIHGDFWTGNVLIPDAPLQGNTDVPILVIDWEMVHLGVPSIDFGQMIAELYTAWLYKSSSAARWMMQGFVQGYGEVADQVALRTAIQIGAHLICVTSTMGWGDSRQVEEAVAHGKDIIVHAWQKDRSWFRGTEMGCLFQ